MAKTDWSATLHKISTHLFTLAERDGYDDEIEGLEESVRDSRYLGRDPADPAAIDRRQGELGVTLPTDYRDFLLVSNGFGHLLSFPRGLCTLLPVEKIGWMRELDRRIGRISEHRKFYQSRPVAELPKDFRVDPTEFERTLLIAESDGNECIVLLPPGPHNDWELWTYDPEQGFTTGGTFTVLMKSCLLWKPLR